MEIVTETTCIFLDASDTSDQRKKRLKNFCYYAIISSSKFDVQIKGAAHPGYSILC